MPKEIRQIRTHLWGEEGTETLPLIERHVPVTNAPCPVPNPFFGDKYSRNPHSCQSCLFSIPSPVLQISRTQDLNRFLFQKKYRCSPFELPSAQAAVPPPRCPLKDLEEPWPGLGAGTEQQAVEQAHCRAPRRAPGALARHQPASLTLPRRTSEDFFGADTALAEVCCAGDERQLSN